MAVMRRRSARRPTASIPGGSEPSRRGPGQRSSKLEIEPSLVEVCGLELFPELLDCPHRVALERVVHHSDAGVVPERDVDMLTSHKVDGDGRAGRAAHRNA